MNRPDHAAAPHARAHGLLQSSLSDFLNIMDPVRAASMVVAEQDMVQAESYDRILDACHEAPTFCAERTPRNPARSGRRGRINVEDAIRRIQIEGGYQ